MSLLILNVVVSGEVRTSQTCLKLEPSYRMRKLAPGSLSRDLSIALIGCHAVWRDRVTGMEAEARQAAPECTGGADSKERCSVRLGRISRDLSDFLWISVRYPIGGSAAVGPSESAVLRTSGIVSRCSASSVLEYLNCLSKFPRREGMGETKSINFPNR